MSEPASSTEGPPEPPREPPPASLQAARRPVRWLRVPIAVWKLFLGVALCQNPLLSVLVIGWSIRFMRRAVLKGLWLESPLRREGVAFEAFVERLADGADARHWPNWILSQNFSRLLRGEPTGRGRLRRLPRACLGSLAANLRLGAQGLLNVWALTLPAGLLWLFAWWAGWNNSFHKGYEQAWIGPATGLLGVGLFIAAMGYVPLAQARQASTGQWRAFYDFGLVRAALRERRRTGLALAAGFAVVSLPVMFLKTLPGYLGQVRPTLATMSGPELVQVLNDYYFTASVPLFLGYLLVRRFAARGYAAALVSAVRGGVVPAERLAPREREALAALGLLESRVGPSRPILLRALGWSGSRLAGSAALAATWLLWFAFVAQIFVSEFLNYHPLVGWLNQPLVHLPWFRFIPRALSGS